MRTIIHLITLIAINTLSYSQEKVTYLPEIKDSSQLIDHGCFILEYDEPNEQALWTYYLMCRSKTNAIAARSDRFMSDPMVITESATDADYRGSGFDRGHLVPAGDMAYSEDCMETSFYYSNMSPQAPSFNRGTWKKLETLVRFWAFTYDTMYVVSGPIYGDSSVYIGPNEVAVPTYYFKAVYLKAMDREQMIGFIMQNEKIDGELKNYVVTIDEIEKRTGLNLYASICPEKQAKLEEKSDKRKWTWKAGEIVHDDAVLKQCSGTTKSGEQCKRKTSDPSGLCYQHK